MLREYLLSLGYSESVITMIMYNREISNYNGNDLCIKIDDCLNKLLSLGYNNDEVMKMIERYPEMCLLDDSVIDNKIKFLGSLGYDINNIKRLILSNPRILCVKDSNITNIIYTLVNLKYNYNDVISMSLKYPFIYSLGESDILLRYHDLMTLGYHQDETKEITKKIPNLYGAQYDSFKEKIDYMKEIGFPLNVIKKVTKEKGLSYIDLYTFKNNIKYIGYYGFSMDDIISMAYDYPMILCTENNNIGDKMRFFYSLGFNHCNDIIKNNARILSYTDGYIVMYIDLFKEYNFSMDDIRGIIKINSKIFNINLKELCMKLEFFRQMRLSRKIINNPNILFRNIDIMHSRYEYLKSIGESIGSKKIDLLLKSNGDFSRTYKISTSELLDSYNNNDLYAESVKRRVRRKI